MALDFTNMTKEQIELELSNLDLLRTQAKAEIERKENAGINQLVTKTITDLRTNNNLTWKQIRYFSKEMTKQCVDKVDD